MLQHPDKPASTRHPIDIAIFFFIFASSTRYSRLRTKSYTTIRQPSHNLTGGNVANAIKSEDQAHPEGRLKNGTNGHLCSFRAISALTPDDAK
jgi:hypothetical protein